MLQEEEKHAETAPHEAAAWLEHLPTYYAPFPPEPAASHSNPSPWEAHASAASAWPHSAPPAAIAIEAMPTQPLDTPPAPPSTSDDDKLDGPYEGMIWVRPPKRYERRTRAETEPKERQGAQPSRPSTAPETPSPAASRASRAAPPAHSAPHQSASAYRSPARPPDQPRVGSPAPRDQRRSQPSWASGDARHPRESRDDSRDYAPPAMRSSAPAHFTQANPTWPDVARPQPSQSRQTPPARPYSAPSQPAPSRSGWNAPSHSRDSRSGSTLEQQTQRWPTRSQPDAPARSARPFAHSPASQEVRPTAPPPAIYAPASHAPGRVRLDGAGVAEVEVPTRQRRETKPIPLVSRPLSPVAPPRQTRRVAERERVVSPTRVRSQSRGRAVLAVLAILLLVNIALQFNRRPLDVASDQYAALSRVNACEQLGKVPDVLFLGSSRVVHGADAQLIDQVVAQDDGLNITSCNAGDFGSTFELDYYMLKRFIEDGYAPKLVVENLWEMNLNGNARGGSLPADADPEHFAETLSVADLGDLPSLWPRFSQASTQNAAIDFTASKLFPLYGDRIAFYKDICGALGSALHSQQPVGPCGEDTSQISSVLRDWYAKADRNGWVAQTDPPLGTMTATQIAERSGAETAYIDTYLANFKIGGEQPEYLRKLIALAQAHGIKVALVTSPLDAMYFKDVSASTWNEIIAYWRSVARATGVPYYDESHAPGYTNMDFVDPQHPSIEGAHRFSTWMARTIVGPALTCHAPACVWK